MANYLIGGAVVPTLPFIDDKEAISLLPRESAREFLPRNTAESRVDACKCDYGSAWRTATHPNTMGNEQVVIVDNYTHASMPLLALPVVDPTRVRNAVVYFALDNVRPLEKSMWPVIS
ncbi:MAG: hypothetical protein KIS73_26460 [Enhydrobacter sp.]|nr:hypothetical protein [Enhydrobacter sp.]